jgi:hypothetical protein
MSKSVPIRKSNLLAKRVFLYNIAFGTAILYLMSRVHVALFVIMLPDSRKIPHSAVVSDISWNIYIYIYIYIYTHTHAHRVSQEERTIFWEVIVSVILSKKLFRTVSEIEPF